jgi:hypothetical protein
VVFVLLHPRANSLFGQAETQYDFSKLDVGQLKDRARELEQQQRGMKKKVNPKVMNMIDTCVLFLPCFCCNLLPELLNYLVSKSARRA